MKGVRKATWIAALMAAMPASVGAGAFVFADESAPNRRLHQDYYGVGGELGPTRVCVDISVNESLAIAAEPAVRNVIATFNRFRSLPDHTYAFAPDATVPAGMPDFETILLHEFLHANGLDHPNHANAPSGNGTAPYNGTRSGDGANDVLDLLANADGIDGSADDDRGDDVNFNWFVRGSNDSSTLPGVVDTTTLTRDTTLAGALPGAQRFAANGNRAVLAALGHVDAEAASVQGARAGESQRHLHHEDLASLMLARAGIDGVAGTADDYRSQAEYAGRFHDPQGGECNIVVRFDESTAFASTLIGGVQMAPEHWRMIYPTRMRFHPAVNWHFTSGPNTLAQIVADTPDPSAGLSSFVVQVDVAEAAGNMMAGLPRGEVVVRDGPRDDAQTATCTIAVVNGSGQCTFTPLRAGRKTLTADYLGWGGWDGGSASVTHDVTGALAFSAITHDPAPSALGASVAFGWTLSPPASAPPAHATGTVLVKDAPDCASPPLDPAHQCTATLPAQTCSITFASSGTKSMQLCYSGDSAIAPASASITHAVLGPRVTTTDILAQVPQASAPFEAYTVSLRVRETPDLGGHPQGSVVMRDGPVGDPLTRTCTIVLTGIAGEIGTCTLASVQAGARTLVADFAAQGLWAASSTQATHVVGRLEIDARRPATSVVGQAVSVSVALDVRAFATAPAPTGTITVSDGVDQCQIVLPASSCLWRGRTTGSRTLVASWPGDANYAATNSAAVTHVVTAADVDDLRWVSEPAVAVADHPGPGDTVASPFGLSADGRYVAFSSLSSTLVDGDGNGVEDVFVHDQLSGTVERVSVGFDGTEANGLSRYPSISADGRYVAFESRASNLVPGDSVEPDVFVKDRLSGTIVRATTRANGSTTGTEYSFVNLYSSLSADGRQIAFATFRPLSASDGNGRMDVYVKDLDSGAVDLVSSTSADVPGSDNSSMPSISADGRHVVFASTAALVPNMTPSSTANKIFVKDRVTRVTRAVSAAADGTIGNRECNDRPAISSDGRFATFQCTSDNIAPGGWGGEKIFVKDLGSGAVEVVSGSGSFTNALSPAISGDGRYVVFQQGFPGGVGYIAVMLRDRQTGALVAQSVNPAGTTLQDAGESWVRRTWPAISADGRFVSFRWPGPQIVANDDNNVADVFVRDRQAATTRRASATWMAPRNNGDSRGAVLRRDADAMAFVSGSARLVDGDANGVDDVFLRTRAGVVTRLSVAADGSPANGASSAPAFADAANAVAFVSAASNLVAGDSNGRADVFVKRIDDGAITRVSLANGAQVAVDAIAPVSIGSDGQVVVFTSDDGSPYAGAGGDSNGFRDVVRIDRGTGNTRLVSRSPADGALGNGDSGQAAMSDNAARIAFVSDATNFGLDQGNSVRDVFVYAHADDRIRFLASSDANGVPGNGVSEQPAISADGRYVAFASSATNLVPGDSNGLRDIFVKDLDSGAIERVNTSAAGSQGLGGDCHSPSLDGTGRYVGFVCAQDNLVPGDSNALADYFVKDRSSGVIERVSQRRSGLAADAAARGSTRALADDGQVVFDSNASNLFPGLDTGAWSNVFLNRFGKRATSTRISAVAPSPARVNLPYRVDVEVLATGGVPTGGVLVSDGVDTCTIAALTPGQPSTGFCMLSSTSTGDKTLVATYAGDAGNEASTSPGEPHRVADVPAPPTLAGVASGDASATLQFSAPASDGGLAIDRYVATCGAQSAQGQPPEITVSGLTNGVAVNCSVAAHNAFGDSAPSNTLSVTPATVPDAPAITGITALATGARIAFTTPFDGGSPILDYIASCVPGPVVVHGLASPIQVDGLTPHQVYRCTVRATNAVEYGPTSAEVGVIPGEGGDSADLAITKSNGTGFVDDGQAVPYLITVRNHGPAGVIGARVEDALAPDFADAAWTCVALANAVCAPAGNGALDLRVDLPVQSEVRILFSAVPATTDTATPLSNIASVTPPDDINDPQLTNNVASDGPDIRGIFRDGFEGP